MALKDHHEEGLCLSQCPGLGILGLAGCLYSAGRLLCAWQWALHHHLVSLVLLTGYSHGLGEGHKEPIALL